MKVKLFIALWWTMVEINAHMIVSTVNLWNVMFNWDVRKHRIAQMIKTSRPDVIAFQEVRGQSGTDNQLIALASLLPREYRWCHFMEAHNATMKEKSVSKKWGREGIGILSRRKVLEVSSLRLSSRYGPDTNARVVLHAVVEMEPGLVANILVVHLSYHRQQQCFNVAEILGYINAKRLKNLIILGDFNTYNDFDWPIKVLTDHMTSRHGLCTAAMRRLHVNVSSVEALVDSWQAISKADKGLTFSNMPTPGYESRPDRILVSKPFQVMTAYLGGNGTYYRKFYQNAIFLNRFKYIVYSSYLSYNGKTGYPCFQDCGPRGSCRCGVCVSGGEGKSCDLPDCNECSRSIFVSVVVISILLLTTILHVIYSVITILVLGSGNYGNTLYSILGCNCCLCNPKLFQKIVRSSQRRHKLLRVCHMWPLFRLPPYCLFFLSVGFIVVVVLYANHVLFPVTQLANQVMDEEFYPSDHLMLSIYLQYLQ